MSTPSDWWMDWAIWGAILLVFLIAMSVIVGRIIHGVRNPDEPANPDDPTKPPLL